MHYCTLNQKVSDCVLLLKGKVSWRKFISMWQHVCSCMYLCTRVCVCVHVRLWENGGGGDGYMLVMLTEFYKLWLTPLPTADWILNKQSQVDESRGVCAQTGEELLHQCGASPTGPPHQPVLFLAAAVERCCLWGGWVECGMFKSCVQGWVT